MPSESEAVTGEAPALPDRRFVQGLFAWLAPRYDAVVATYSLGQDFRWKHVLVRKLTPRPGERALDLGCGTGGISARLERRLGLGAVVGMDLSPGMLDAAHRRAPARPLLRGDAQRLPFPDATFDLVTAGYLLKYVQLEAFVDEVRRVLRPGGRFGGYDFSSPVSGSIAGTAYGQYLHHVVPWVGHRRDGGSGPYSQMLEFLAQLASASGWERRMPNALRRSGFGSVRTEPTLGGAVTWIWAAVPRTPERPT